jgi:primosomal protein N'
MKGLCPSCGSKYIGGMRAGTEQVETLVKQAFPEAKTLRMDADTTSAKGEYERILSSFANEEADILIGTQMIVKGHDFPNVTVVGILAADLSLGVPDYRASERTFQLIAQACGRAGRGEKKGYAVIQTYQPDNYAITSAAAQDYKAFFDEEIAFRLSAGYPPAVHMMAVQYDVFAFDAALAAVVQKDAAVGIVFVLIVVVEVVLVAGVVALVPQHGIVDLGILDLDPSLDLIVDFFELVPVYGAALAL